MDRIDREYAGKSSGPGATPTGLRDFFRYHGAWAPGIRLFRSLRFKAKAFLISAVLLVPALVLGSAYLADVQEQVVFSQKEREGVALVRKVLPVLQALLEVRNTTQANLAGFDAKQDAVESRQRVDQSLGDLAAFLRRQGDPLGQLKQVEAIQAQWAAAAGSRDGVDDQGRTVFGPVTASLVKMVDGIGDASNLALDRDLDTLSMINAVFMTMPGPAEDLGQLWGWGTFGVAKGGLESPEMYKRYAIWSAQAGSGIRAATRMFNRAMEATPALKTRLDLKGFDVALKFQKSADVSDFIKEADEPKEVYARGKAALGAYFGVFDKALPVLDELLGARIRKLEGSRDMKGLVVVLSLLAGGYLFYCFSRVMDGGLREVTRHMDNMANGDLTSTPKPWGTDEAAHLMQSLARMQVAMRQIVTDVRGQSVSIVSASRELADGSQDLSMRTEQTAARLQATATSLEQINATLGNTSAHTREAARLASTNETDAESGGTVITRAVGMMNEIQSASARIADIIGVIDGIAFQTNILALNAAVEAARAGEQGRGFAVVAAEVRALAHRSATAAKEIKTLINDTVEKVQGGTVVVEGAGSAMRHLVDGAKSINKLLGEIAVASEQQGRGVEQVGQSVSGLDEMTQRNAALVEQTAAASAQLRQRAECLGLAVARFKVD